MNVLILMIDVSIKSLLLAAVAIVAMKLLRVQNNHLRHRVWTFVLAGMLAMPALSIATPKINIPLGSMSWIADHQTTAPTTNETESAEIAIAEQTEFATDRDPIADDRAMAAIPAEFASEELPNRDPLALAPPSPASLPNSPATRPILQWQAINWFAAAMATYITVTLLLLLRLTIGLWRAGRLSYGSNLVQRFGAQVYECDRIDVPVTVGWIRPKILLPASWRSWSEEKCTAVLSHERSHIQRGDYFVNLMAELNCCIHWYHPLSWGLLRRLSDLAEQNCDDAVIARTGERAKYARHLLEIAAGALERQRGYPVSISMARSADVESRIHAILDQNRPLAQRLSWRRTVLLFVCVMPVVCFAAALSPTISRAIGAESTASDDGVVSLDGKTMSIRGKVVSANGQPVAGARVRAVYSSRESDELSRSQRVVGQTDTDEQGNYSLSYDTSFQGDRRGAAQHLNMPQFLEMFATADGHAVGLLGKRPGLQAKRIDTTIVMGQSSPLSGRLVDLEGQPIAGVKMSVVSVMSASESLDGWFERASKNRRPDSMARMAMAQNQGTEPVHFPGLSLASMVGKLASVTSDSDGKFSIDQIGPDRLVTLLLESPDIARSSIQMVSRKGPAVYAAYPTAGRDNRIYGDGATITLEPANVLRGTITDKESGRPIAGCEVMVRSVGGSAIWRTGYLSTKTNEKGEYEISELPLDVPESRGHRIRVIPPANAPYFPTDYVVRLSAGAATIHDIRMARSRWVTGRVTDTSGAPVRAMVAYLPRLKNKAAERFDNFQAGMHTVAFDDFRRNNIDGSFKVPAIEGRGVLCVTAEMLGRYEYGGGVDDIAGLRKKKSGGVMGNLAVYHLMGDSMVNEFRGLTILGKDPDPNVDVQLRPLSKSRVRLVDQDGNAVTGCNAIGLLPPRPISTRFGLTTDAPIQTDLIEVLGLAPDKPRYVSFHHPKKGLGAIVDLKSSDFDGDTPKRIELKQTATIRGRVIDSDGNPITDAQVYVTSVLPERKHKINGWTQRTAQVYSGRFNTDQQGRFEINELVIPGAKYELGISSGQHSQKTHQTEVVAAGENIDIGDQVLKISKPDAGVKPLQMQRVK